MINAITLVALIKKEFIQVFRDKRMLGIMLVVPVLQVTVFGYAANLELTRVDTVVVDDNHTRESHDFIEALGAEKTFRLHRANAAKEAEREMRDGEASMALVIPREFSRKLGAGETASVQALFDGSDPSQAQAAIGALQQFLAMQNLARRPPTARPALEATPAPLFTLEARFFFNPGLKSRLFMVPGTAAAVLMIVTAIVTAMGLTREREVGTMEQLLVTPMSSVTLMLGKTIPYAIFGLIDETLILLAGNFLFGVPIRGVGLVYLAATAYLFATLGIGLFIATIARTQQQALLGGFFFMIPAILLSGFLTSVDAMPSWVRPVTWINPVRYFVDISRSVLLRGSSFGEIFGALLSLTALGFALIGGAAWRFRKQIA